MQTQISLRKLRLYAFHGCMEQEQKVGAEFEVSLTVNVGSSAAAAIWGDELTSTVDYGHLYETVAAAFSHPSSLLEHAAGRILKDVFMGYPTVQSARIEITKVNPPIGAACEGASVVVEADNPCSHPISLLILDFDGTLADTSTAIVETMRHTMQTLVDEVPTDDEIRQTIGLPLDRCVARLLGAPLSDERVAQGVETYRQEFDSEAVSQTVKAYPGVVDTLRDAKGVGLHIAIATSRGRESTLALCERIGIAPYIDMLVAVEDVVQAKPHPEAVVNILTNLNVEPTEALLVGDANYDILMGRSAGVRTCGVTYGNQTPAQLADAGADMIIDDFREISAFI